MPQVMPTFVRVTGIRRGRFIEFEYMVGDPDLCVELIMPIPAFAEFCERQNATIDDRGGLLTAIKTGNSPEASVAGLYHPPSWHQNPQEH